MNLDMDQIAKAFCSHRFSETYPYMADEIKWNIVGQEELVGREAVLAQCKKGLKFLETVSSTITKLVTISAETCVVVEGGAQFQDKDNQTSSVASCDVLQFSEGQLVKITSYVIDLN